MCIRDRVTTGNDRQWCQIKADDMLSIISRRMRRMAKSAAVMKHEQYKETTDSWARNHNTAQTVTQQHRDVKFLFFLKN